MLCVDLCSGLGGFSEAFLDRGHDVVRIDNDSRFKDIPNTIIADIRALPLRKELKPDILVMSPPCTEFARESMPWCKTGKEPDLVLIKSCIALKNYLKPEYWVLENVRGSQKYINKLINLKPKRCGSYYLWGNFPIFDSKFYKSKQKISGILPEKRSQIPYAISKALCLAVERSS